MTTEELKVIITAQTAGLNKQIKEVQAQLGKLEKSTEKSCSKINSSFKNIFKGVSFVLILRQLNLVMNKAINMASNLEEVQNVVDVAFGSMSAEVEAFAKTAIKSYGMSELSAKQMASTFMAMANGMGLARKAGKNMSLQLTALAGDMASFYNVEQSVAQTALNSVFTGETESLKKFGIVLTEANLQAFALTQGIKKNYSAMSQAEKVALRYNYVLQATAQAQGDFARTSGSWANQTRILKEQWSQLLGILGKGLTQVLTPIIKALNTMLSSLISVGNAIAKVFGGKLTNKMETNVKDTASSAGDLDTSLGDANDTAKKLSKTIAGFDELNILTDNSKDSSTDTGTGGSTGNTNIADFEINDSEIEGQLDTAQAKIEKFLQETRQKFEEWKNSLPKLEINFDTEEAMSAVTNIGTNILSALGGLGDFVIKIGIEIANDLDIGTLAQSFLSLVESASALASTMIDVLAPAFLTFYESSGLSNLVQWLGETLADAINFAKEKLDGWKTWFDENSEQINVFADNLGKAVQPLTDIVIKIGDTAWGIFKGVLDGIDTALKNIATSLINMDEGQINLLLTLIAAVAGGFVLGEGFFKLSDWLIGFSGLATEGSSAWKEFVDAIKRGDSLKDIGYLVTEPFKAAGDQVKFHIGEIKTALLGVGSVAQQALGGLGSLAKSAFSALISPAGLAVSAVLLLAGAFAYLWNTNEEFREAFTNLWENVLKPIFQELGETIKAVWEESIVPLIDQLKSFWEEVMSPLGEQLKEFWENDLKPALEEVGEVVLFLLENIIKVLAVVVTTVISLLATVLENVATVVGAIIDYFQGVITFFQGVFTGDISMALQGIYQCFSAVFGSIYDLVINTIDGIINTVQNAISAIKSLFSTARSESNEGITVNAKTKTYASQVAIPAIPALAKGGVISSPTVAMVGEYSGASNNPEIVAPQSILKETMDDANLGLINAIYAIGNQISKTVEDKDGNVYIDGDNLTRKITKRQKEQQRYNSASLVTV